MRQEIRPFLRWAGSKRQILSRLEPFWQGAGRYVEPFAGSACLFFRLQPAQAILGDLNRHLISTYRTVRNDADGVYRVLSTFRNSVPQYKRIRSLSPSDLSLVEQAARFIYLNRFCFNGLYRTNLNGEFNVPYGGGKSGNLPSLEHLRSCAQVLKRARLVGGSFEKTLRLVRTGDFVYMDPPFSVAARRVFKEYNAAVFTDEDVRTLRLWMEKLASAGISFLVSYAESDEAEYLARNFCRMPVSVKRHIAGGFSKRVRCDEILINYNARNTNGEVPTLRPCS
ncbi:MAG TPA: Dam family site-specific DNA-(adenine-N6)-methyltransferase [Terriglobales bacterium]|nr:Dam family site-specific DNA-(adenine-N6)-methyltransferase [Terriglobales bacterium]